MGRRLAFKARRTKRTNPASKSVLNGNKQPYVNTDKTVDFTRWNLY